MFVDVRMNFFAKVEFCILEDEISFMHDFRLFRNQNSMTIC